MRFLSSLLQATVIVSTATCSIAQTPPSYKKPRRDLVQELNAFLQQSTGIQNDQVELPLPSALIGDLDQVSITKIGSDTTEITMQGIPDAVTFQGNNAIAFVPFKESIMGSFSRNNFYRVTLDGSKPLAKTSVGSLHAPPVFSPDGSKMTIDDSSIFAPRDIKIISAVDGKSLFTVKTTKVSLSTQFVGSSQTMVITGADEMFQVTNPSKIVMTGETIDSTPATSHDGRWVAANSGPVDMGVIKIFNMRSGVTLRTIPTKKHVTALAFSQDGTVIYAGNEDGTVSSYQVSTRRRKWTFNPDPSPFPGRVDSIQVKSGKIIVVSHRPDDGEIDSLDPITGKKKWGITVGQEASVSISPDGKGLAVSDLTNFSTWSTSDGTNYFTRKSGNDETVAATYNPAWSSNSKMVAFPGETQNLGIAGITSHIWITPAQPTN